MLPWSTGIPTAPLWPKGPSQRLTSKCPIGLVLEELVDLVHRTPLGQPQLWGRAVGFKGATQQDGVTVESPNKES